MTRGSQYKPFVVAVILASFSVAASAELYRWVDENGRVHYSDTPPPPNAKVEKETKKPQRPTAAPAQGATPGQAPKSYVEKEADFRKRRVEQAEKEAADQKALQEAAEKKRNCDQSRNQLVTLKAGGRVARRNAQGEPEYMDEKQIAQEISLAEKAVSEWCN